MGDAINSVIRIVDFTVQGVLAALVLSYLFYPWISDSRIQLRRGVQLLKPYLMQGVSGTVMMTVAIGGAYALGVIVNGAGYWFLQPAHKRIIKNAEKKPWETSHLDVVKLPLLRWRDTEDTRADTASRIENVGEEVDWRNREEKTRVVEDTLDPLVKQLRIVRGTAICSFGLIVVSVIKAICWLVLWAWERFKHLPSTEVAEEEEYLESAQTHSMKAPLIAGVFGLAVYLVCLGVWQDMETDYHLVVRLGEASSHAHETAK